MFDSRKPRFLPRLRVMVGDEIVLGPGKIDLLEAIAHSGSISSGARELGLSYRRAWDLVDTMNRHFQRPLVTRVTGGKGGGGAELSELGKRVVNLYRNMEAKTKTTVQEEWNEIQKLLKQTAGQTKIRPTSPKRKKT